MPSSFTIIQLQSEDVAIAGYRALRIQLWPECREDCDREIRDLLANPDVWAVFVASLDGQVIGFVEVHLRDYVESAATSPVGFLEGWFVAAAHRRQGVGKALVKAAENWALSRGCSEMGSDTQPNNAVSIQAHGRIGYREVERLVCFLKRIGESQ